MRYVALFMLGVLLLLPSFSSAISCVDLERTLSLNMNGDDVFKLQEFLRDNAGYTGKIGGIFGPLTEAAVKSWQQKKGITATGTVGPRTRAAMRCSAPEPQKPEPSQKTAATAGTPASGVLARGAKGPDVVELQRFLIQQGVLAAGNDSGFFGALTEAALQKWQSSQGIVSYGSPNTTGYGSVGPRTKAAIAAARAGGGASSSSFGGSAQKNQSAAPTYSSQSYTQSEATSLIRQRIMPSVVQVGCTDRDGGEEAMIGSGVYTIDETTRAPMVITNAHVVVGSDGKFHGCNVYFPRAADGAFYDSAYEVGEATLFHNVESNINGQIVNGIDYAVLTLTAGAVDTQGIRYPFPPKQEDAIAAISALCRKPDPTINIGDPIFTIGYPGVGGSSLTLSQGVISGFLGDFNEYIKVSASTLSGNSGGLAIGSTDVCEYGIPTQATSDIRVGGNLGILLSTDFINTFIENMTGNTTYAPPDVSTDSSVYLTRSYSLPDFSMNYPALWTMSQIAPNASGTWGVRFTSPSEGALDNFTEYLDVSVTPSATEDDLTQAIEQIKNFAVARDTNATEAALDLGGVQAYYIFYNDSTSGMSVFNADTIFLKNGRVYTISVYADMNGPGLEKYTKVFDGMFDSIAFQTTAQSGQASQMANVLTALESILANLQRALKEKLMP